MRGLRVSLPVPNGAIGVPLELLRVASAAGARLRANPGEIVNWAGVRDEERYEYGDSRSGREPAQISLIFYSRAA